MPSKRNAKQTSKHAQETAKVSVFIQVASLAALVAVVGFDALSPNFSVPTIVYAIIAGMGFGVGGKDFIKYVTGRK